MIQVRKELRRRGAGRVGIEYKLQQVFLNLFLNARDAMPKGGWLTIATRGRATRRGRGGRHRGRHPAEHLSRIYDPFFTTKAIGKGTGPGPFDHLRHRAGARRLDHRARAPGQGTRSLRFQAGAGARRWPRPEGGHGTSPEPAVALILVIDDEEIMREILEALLTQEGYEVRRAPRHEGARAGARCPFDAAIVDVMMPGMDGIEVLEELKKLDDELPVLMITAFARSRRRSRR